MNEKNQPLDRPVEPQVIEALARQLTIWAGCAFALAMILSVLSLRCLYADGSYQLAETLKAGGYVEIAKNRGFASLVYEFPVVIALHLGVTNLHVLELLFGIGCFLYWPVVLMACGWLAPHRLWLAMLGCAAGYLNSGFMPVGEYNVAHAFFWPVLFAILFARPLTPLAAVLLLGAATILLFSYESLLFLGPPLALLALGRAWFRRDPAWARGVLTAAALLLLTAAGIALDGVLHPQCPSNLSGFKNGVHILIFNPPWSAVWSAVWLLLAIGICATGKGFTGRHFRLEQALFGWVIIIWALGPLLHPDNTGAERQHEIRCLQLLVPFGLMVMAWVLSRWPRWFEARWAYLTGFSAAFLLAQSLCLLCLIWQWHGFVSVWRGVLAVSHGPVPLADTPFANPSLQGETMNFDWTWANPGLSVLLSPTPRIHALILPPGTVPWQPFDPLDATNLPALQRYGINYDDYVVALKKALAATNGPASVASVYGRHRQKGP